VQLCPHVTEPSITGTHRDMVGNGISIVISESGDGSGAMSSPHTFKEQLAGGV